MTWDEFRLEWYPQHCACFTGIQTWMAKLEKSSDGPASRDVMKSWYAVLRDVDLQAAKNASHQMHAGQIEEPKGFDRHPAAIRRASGVGGNRGSVPERRYDSDGNQTFACLLCRDDGFVFCWHPETVAKVSKSGECKMPLYSCALPCSCHAGDTRSRAFPNSPRFDPKRALPLSLGVTDPDDQAALLEWLRTRDPVKPVGYHDEFAEFATQREAF